MNLKYNINLRWSEDDLAWIAEVPELPGCMADGATQEEAIHNAQRSIKDWVEEAERLDRAVPLPDPSIDNVIKAAELLNKSELARKTGIQIRTLNAKIKRRSPLSRDEAKRIKEALNDAGVCLI